MSISGVGTVYNYNYKLASKSIASESGNDDGFTRYYYEKITNEESIELEYDNKTKGTFTVGDSTYVDKDIMQCAKQTNSMGRFYTAEEMHQMQMRTIAANEKKLKEQQTSYEEMYKRSHPDYNGERIFRTISGGKLYTANEIDKLLYKEMLDRMGMTEAEDQQKREEWKKQMGYPGYN